MHDFEYDELADTDPLLLQDEPMRPIRLQYVTLSSEKALLVDTLERLGLVHAWVGTTLYALNESDSIRLALDAREKLERGGIAEPTDYQLGRMVEALVTELVMRERVERSLRPELVGQLLRAEGDVILAARGTEIKANIAARIAEYEAA
jgi:hypothetical protein